MPIPGNKPVPVNDTLHIPYIYVGILNMVFPNGEEYYGTGTLILEPGKTESSYVLTCAHNLYDAADGGQAASVTFTQAYSHVFDPYPPITAAELFYPAQYPGVAISRKADISLLGQDLLDANINYDFAVVKLATPIQIVDNPCASPVVKTTDQLENLLVQINGYGYYETTMSHATGTIAEVTDLALLYGITTQVGASGSAIMMNDNKSIVGIHTRSVPEKTLNQGVRITEDVLNLINTWMGVTPAPEKSYTVSE